MPKVATFSSYTHTQAVYNPMPLIIYYLAVLVFLLILWLAIGHSFPGNPTAATTQKLLFIVGVLVVVYFFFVLLFGGISPQGVIR